jgi:ferrous iron transport protein B
MKVALFGNPNTGKSSVFNLLTGLRQQIGNFPGVTVEKKTGTLHLSGINHELTDFPGCYSIYPRSGDEEVVYDVLSNREHPDFPDIALVVLDQSNLSRNLFLFSQIYDLGIPCIMVLNRMDIAEKRGVQVDLKQLQAFFPLAKIVQTNARVGLGKDRLILALSQSTETVAPISSASSRSNIAEKKDAKSQETEAEKRYALIQKITSSSVKTSTRDKEIKSKIDQILVHPLWGYVIFAGILLIVFQFIFTFAKIPMEFIDGQFNALAGWLNSSLPSGMLSDLLTQGVVPGIGGVLVFIPQIAILFFFIALLEQSGYLARVVFIMDRLMRPLGLNGKSVVPLLSSVACAIPGVMAARTISDKKERLITILVSPFMSCSARIPVYTLLIAIVIPNVRVLGFVQLQGLVLFGLYFLGIVSALLIAWVLKQLIRSEEKGFLMLELPGYQWPIWKNVGLTIWEKVRVFIVDAGKIILAISILLWALATFGAPKKEDLEKREKTTLEKLEEDERESYIAALKLEESYMGQIGKTIEPVIEPLGYDWKIGISLITSFAAREVFVGSLATIYAVQQDESSNKPLIERLRMEKRKDGSQVYSMATGISLMVFYAFAMQCMATLAVVRRETQSWKWPIIQLVFMGILAYVSAFAVYQFIK